MTAAVTCRTCGGEPRAGARFCDACGAPIASTQPSAEYKQVTVLFADVVRSMDIASTLDTERLRELMGELFERSAAVVHRYGGTVSQFTGDGIMAVFGAPTTLEDHAFRACLTALDIRSKTRQLAAEVQQHDGVMLQLRIGLNSGQVIAGEIGSSAAGYTTIGKHVGMAQRMESAAPAGGVTLLQRGGNRDVEDAQRAIDRLAAARTDPGFVVHEITVLRLRALLARAKSEDADYREFRGRYRKMANDLGVEGHIVVAKAMP